MAFSQDQFRMILSGRRRDAGAGAMRLLLGAASLGYGLAIRTRNALYDHRLFKANHVNAAVLSVGNLTTGGTGKTPLVVWLCQQLTQNSELRTQNSGLAVLTRGYKTGGQSLTDELAVLQRACGGVPVIVNPDRVEGAAAAISQGARVLVLDDGFQHRRLARDLDIVAIDASLPFGYGRLLPAGLLREPQSGLSRAQAVVITRSDLVQPDPLAQIERSLLLTNPRLVTARAIHAPTAVRIPGARDLDCGDLKGTSVHAFCGIGNPDAFWATLARLGARVVGTTVFDDHHACTAGEIAEICRKAAAGKADLILTTEKNWWALDPAAFDAKTRAGYLDIRLEVTAGEDRLMRLIRDALESRILGSAKTQRQEARSKK
jgi:tetraacyldisaccharide 4'-kinase